MLADVHVVVHKPSKPLGSTCVVANPSTSISFTAPKQLLDAGFPVNESTFPLDSNSTNPQAPALLAMVSDCGKAMNASTQPRNSIVYSYGAQGTPKRQLMFSPGGYGESLLSDAINSKTSGATYFVTCYIMGGGENLVDGLNPSNTNGLIVDSVKEGPRVKNIDRMKIESAADLAKAVKLVNQAIQTHFKDVLPDSFASNEERALPPYNSDTIVFSLLRFADDSALESNVETNSVTLVCLGDSERPALCGVDPDQLQLYEKNQKTLTSVVGVMQAIRNSRLRIPYGKSKLTLLLKRAYNGEKSNANNQTNAPTRTFMFVHAFDDDGHAEETFHTLTMAKKVTNVMSVSLGPSTRDLALEKWRLEQDVLELKDELAIARQVHDYRPCIYEQAKPVANIGEEEHKRIQAILRKREETKEKQLGEVRARAQEEAKRIIADEEKKSNMTLQALEEAVAKKREENASLQEQRAKKVKEYEKHLEKIRRRKEDEESTLSKLKDEIKELEEELTSRQEAIDKKRRQLEMTSEDQAKGREAILREREEIRQQRSKVLEERRKIREQWIAQIRDTNEKVLAQVQLLAKERRARQQRDGVSQEEDPMEETEEQVREDIQSIDRYLPKLISLEDKPLDADSNEGIRKQLEEYFEQEKSAYVKKLSEEQENKAKLEKAVESFKSRLQESQTKVLKDQLGEAIKKEQQLTTLVDQVLQYLCNGVRMTKVNSKGTLRRRFFFLSEDHKRLNACDLDDIGMPIGRRKPPVSITLKDVKQVVLGCYTPSFTSFAGEANLQRGRAEAMRNDGSYNADSTPPLTPQNLGRQTYRSFSLLLRGGKTLEVVCDCDSDAEAWILAFKRLFNYRTPLEIDNLRRQARREGKQYIAPECPTSMTWGASFDVRSRDGVQQLAADEAAFCSDQHIPPMLFARIKKELAEKSQSSIITVYDIRTGFTMDLLRSQALYEFFISTNLFPPPRQLQDQA